MAETKSTPTRKPRLSEGKKPEDFDQEQLRIGTQTESEHGGTEEENQRVAMDHLTEDKDYYKKLKIMEDSKLKDMNPLKKAFLQGDNETKTDAAAHALAIQSLPKELLEWGTKNLSSMKKDYIKVLQFKDATIKVRKLLDDLYSGWMERGGERIHDFNRLTMPEIMSQIQSKMEIYVGAADMPEKKEEVKPVEAKPAEPAPAPEVINTKDLTPGIENPEKECPACERESGACICYMGLPTPRLEFDGKTVKIFFKSEWGTEDKENFVEDLKRRAGTVLARRAMQDRVEKASRILSDIKKKIGK